MTYQQARPLPDPLQHAKLSTCGAVRLGTGRWQWLRRLSFVLPVVATTGAGLWLATGLTVGAGPLRPVLLALLFANLLFLAVTGWPGVLGFLLRLMRHRTPVAASPNGSSRTAVLFPIYNEDAHTVFTAAEIMARALIEHRVDRTDIFVLSDTRDPAIALAEEQAFHRLSPLFGDRLRYRRRVQNLRRKAGNIADFCQAWSGDYDYMVVLDADSLMSPTSIATLIGLMDANPAAGVIQTVPYAVGRETLFARIQQFAARLYTPLLVEGLAFWQGEDGNYWGHNAIIRIAPFMAHCELPVLPGREPFGGEILCHDVVEAAMMRRAGWQVWLLPSLAESYEALPANMVDFAQRERRWCQGNLQHMGVLGMPGLRPVGRYHLALGVLTYLSGPLFILFAGLATLDGMLGGGFIAHLLGDAGPARAAFVTLTFFLLYGAKLCSLAAALAHDDTAASFGGRLRLLASAVLEQASAMVSAPILLVFYTRFIGMMLLGRAVQWNAQPRDDRGVSWGEAVQCMRLPVAVGVIWLAGASLAGGTSLHWALSLVPGLLLAMPASVWTSVARFGLLARRCGLFLTEDELSPSPILRAFNRALVRESVPLAHTMPHPQFGYLHPSESEAH